MGYQWPKVLGAWRAGNSDYAGVWSSEKGAVGVPVSGKAHEVLVDPRSRAVAVAVARRPGSYLLRFDYENLDVLALKKTEMHRQFNGHAVFSEDGKTLYTSENDLVTGAGLIGVRDSETLTKRSEFPSHGVGPHALLLDSDGSVLVANGGVLSIPEVGVVHPHIEKMTSSLVRLDPRSGQLLGQWKLPDARLSVRHMVRNPKGAIGIALQSAHTERATRESAPVLGYFDGKSLYQVPAPPSMELGGYAGDIACVSAGRESYFALGCTQAGLVAWWDSVGNWQGAANLPKACALSAHADGLIATTEIGRIERHSPGKRLAVHSREIAIEWENHLMALPS